MSESRKIIDEPVAYDYRLKIGVIESSTRSICIIYIQLVSLAQELRTDLYDQGPIVI